MPINRARQLISRYFLLPLPRKYHTLTKPRLWKTPQATSFSSAYSLMLMALLISVAMLGHCGLAQAQSNCAIIGGQRVPTTMLAGQSYAVSVTTQNVGSSTWTSDSSTPYGLGSQNPQENTTWGLNRVRLPAGTTVAPGQFYSFNFNVTAPFIPGTYHFEWQMVQDNVAWFDYASTDVVITVINASGQLPQPAPPASGLTLWLKADAGISKNASNQVSAWADPVTGIGASPPAGTTAPLWVDGAFNGNPVIRFNGVDNMLQTPVVSLLNSATNGFTLFIVTQPGTSQAQYANIIDFDHATYPYDGLVVQQNGANTNSFYTAWFGEGQWRASAYGVGVDAGRPNIYSVIKHSAGQAIWNTGLEQDYESLPFAMDAGPNALGIGGNVAISNRPYNGDIAEILVYNRNLTEAERLNVNEYLDRKYFTPTNLQATSMSGHAALTWNAAPNAASYIIRRATDSNGPYTTIATTTTPNYTDTNVAGGSWYSYKVAAVTGWGSVGPDSNEASVTIAAPPPAPTVSLAMQQWEGYVSIIWQPNSPGTPDFFHIYRATSLNGVYNEFRWMYGQYFFCNDSGVTPGQTYYYKVKAQNRYGMGPDSNIVTAMAIPFAPTNLTAIGGNAQVTLTWSASTGASKYTVKRATTSNGPYTIIANPTGTSYTDANSANNPITNETTYYYVVTASDGDGQIGGESGNSNEASVIPHLLPTPTNVGAAGADKRVLLSWSSVTGATGYRIYRATSAAGPFTNNIADVSTLSYSDGVNSSQPAGLTNGTTYYYKIVAYNSSGHSDFSATVSAMPTPPPAAPTGLTAVGGNGQVILNWVGNAAATSYNVLRRNNQSSAYGVLASNVTGTTYTNTSSANYPVTNGSTYYYIVVANNAYDSSGNSNEAVATLKPVPPTSLTATAGNALVTLTWTGSAGANSYTVKRGIANDGSYPVTIAVNAPATTYTDSGLSNGTTYYYIVTASNAGGESGASNQAIATPQAPPVAPTLTATAGNQQVVLSWTASANAASYTLKRSIAGGAYAAIPQATGITATTYTDSGLTNGTTYTYVVSATNVGGTSPDSAPASATPQPVPDAPTNLQATAAYKQVTLTWNPSNGATSYNVKRSLSSGNGYVLVASNVTNNSYTDTGLTTGTTYYYVVTAVNNNGESGPSGQASATPLPRFEIANVNNNATLSGSVTVNVVIHDTTITPDELDFSVGSTALGKCAANIGGSWPMLVPTEQFSNGQHTLQVTDSLGNSDSRTVVFQNAVSNLQFSSVFDVTENINGVPQAAHITATVAAGAGWTVKILDDSDNVAKTFSGIGPSIDVTWDGTWDTTGAVGPNGIYKLSITTGVSGGLLFKKPLSLIRQTIVKNSASTQIVIKVPNGLKWRATILDARGETIRTFQGVKSSINLIWDGRDDAGLLVPDGKYRVIIRPLGVSTSTSRPASGITTRSTVPFQGIINQYKITDTLVVIDVAAFQGDNNTNNHLLAAIDYARFIRGKIFLKKGIDFSDEALPLVCGANLSTPQIAGIINYELTYVKLNLVYTLSHGWPEPSFTAGGFVWFPYRNQHVIDNPSTAFDVSAMVAGQSYGDRTDPPKLVWIDSCDSAGHEPNHDDSPNTYVNQYYDSSWATCFGIDYSNGYEGVFLGWSGYMFLYLEGNDWTTWRQNLWTKLFVESRNFQTAWADTNALEPVGARPYGEQPPQRSKWDGTGTTSF